MAQNDLHTAPNAPAPSTVDARLERIEHSLDELKARAAAPEASKEKQGSGKTILAIGFGFVGLKLGGFIGAKLGILADMARGYRANKWEGAKAVWETILTFGKAEKKGTDVLKYTILGTTFGTLIGSVGGALLGWNRGDRLKSPGDLFSHPVDSLKKIFGPAPAKPSAPAEPSTASAPVGPTTVHPVQHEGVVSATALETQR